MYSLSIIISLQLFLIVTFQPSVTSIVKNADHSIIGSLQQSENALLKLETNATLDITGDASNGTGWVLSRTDIVKWFEYYENTDALKAATNDPTRCPALISGSIDQLGTVNGVWVACQDPELPPECPQTPSDPCHPAITMTKYYSTVYRSIKIRLWVGGMAIVRLGINANGGTCFDYSRRKDPFSTCQFVPINNTETGWIQTRMTVNDTENIENFAEFYIQLITRFKFDIALVDKVEATELLLCEAGSGEIICPSTTPIPPVTTLPPETTLSTDEPTTIITTTEIPIYEIWLDIEDDTNDERWELPSLRPEWLEYHENSASIEVPSNESNLSCASIVQTIAQNLPPKDGIWSSCYDYNQSWDHSQEDNNKSEYPIIQYAATRQILHSVKVTFFIHRNASMRLHVGKECEDYSGLKDPESDCIFKPIRQEAGRWYEIFWKPRKEQLQAFELELITRYPEDFVLLDVVNVSYTECYDEQCSPPPTKPSTVTPTTISTTVTTVKTTSTSTLKTTNPAPSTPPPTLIYFILDVLEDADNNWQLPSFDSNWLEYYDNSSSIKEPANDLFYCATTLYAMIKLLPVAEGLWSSCNESNEKSLIIYDGQKTNVSQYPTIAFYADTNLRLRSVKLDFSLYRSALLRLHLGETCMDYSSSPHPNSTCEFIKIENYLSDWQGSYYKLRGDEELTHFKLELITRTPGDLVLVHAITAETICLGGPCDFNTTTASPTTTKSPGSSSTERSSAVPFHLSNTAYPLALYLLSLSLFANIIGF